MTRKRGRPRSSDRLRADRCAVIDVRDLPPLPQPIILNPTRHDLTLTWPDRSRMDVTLFTVTTRPNYGGTRQWLSCPSCGGRCRKLYSPAPARSSFACRRCWRLVYDSQYVTSPQIAFLRRWLLRPPSTNTAARRQRTKRFAAKLMNCSEDELTELLGAR